VTVTPISGQLGVSSAARAVMHISALPSCAARFLDLVGLGVTGLSE
jgi:hypothetical protein